MIPLQINDKAEAKFKKYEHLSVQVQHEDLKINLTKEGWWFRILFPQGTDLKKQERTKQYI